MAKTKLSKEKQEKLLSVRKKYEPTFGNELGQA